MVTAIIAAAGRGTRMGREMNKLLIILNERPVLSYTIDVFEQCREIDEVIVVVGEEDVAQVSEMVADYDYRKVRQIIAGGAERQYSIANALKKLSPGTRWVVVHDGARPFVRGDLIARAVGDARKWGAAGVAVPVKDTIKIVDGEGFIERTPDRKRLWAMQTPQVFAREIIERAYRFAEERDVTATDDAALVEAMGVKIKLLMGDYANIKITTPEDLCYAEVMLRRGRLCE